MKLNPHHWYEDTKIRIREQPPRAFRNHNRAAVTG